MPYEIKWPEWTDDESASYGVVNGRRVAVCYSVDLDTRVNDIVWYWFAEFNGGHATSSLTGERLTREQCKAAAEVGYRNMLAEYLEEAE